MEYLPLTRTRRKRLTCGFATPRPSPAPVRAPKPSAKRPCSLRDRLNERDIANLITAYHEGATAARVAAAHGLSLNSVHECQTPPAHRRCPLNLTRSTNYQGNASRDTSVAVAAHAQRSPRAQRQLRTVRTKRFMSVCVEGFGGQPSQVMGVSAKSTDTRWYGLPSLCTWTAEIRWRSAVRCAQAVTAGWCWPWATMNGSCAHLPGRPGSMSTP